MGVKGCLVFHHELDRSLEGDRLPTGTHQIVNATDQAINEIHEIFLKYNEIDPPEVIARSGWITPRWWTYTTREVRSKNQVLLHCLQFKVKRWSALVTQLSSREPNGIFTVPWFENYVVEHLGCQCRTKRMHDCLGKNTKWTMSAVRIIHNFWRYFPGIKLLEVHHSQNDFMCVILKFSNMCSRKCRKSVSLFFKSLI